MNKKLKEFNLTEEDKCNLIEYLDKSEFNKPEASLLVSLSLEYEFGIIDTSNYLIKETELQLLVNSVYCMSNEIKQLRKRKNG